MPKPRFAKLEPTLQRHILDVAARELALHGFEGASYNRIIEESGTSKGAMYYYFADKADLYATVLADSISRFQRSIGPLPAIEGPEDFWSAVRHIALQGIHHYRVDPHAIGLARSVAADAARGALPAAMGPLRQVMTAWMLDLMAMGTRVGALRTDLPADLLLTAALSLSEGIDLWLSGQVESMAETDIERVADGFADLYRRLGQP
jgi:AcrR family transcriptional regulator